MFNPAAMRQGDTDLEAQELFHYFNKPKMPGVKFGKGTLEFHWAGRPTTPTRAHFLTNWTFADQFRTHTLFNFKHSPNEYVLGTVDHSWRSFLTKVMGSHHGLRPIWNNFDNFPLENHHATVRKMTTAKMTPVDQMMASICLIVSNLRIVERPAQAGAYHRATWTGDARPVGRR